MNLYDLETLIENHRLSTNEQMDDILLHDVKFKVVLDENIIPPLEVLDDKADRELILARQRVYSEKRLERPLIFTKIKKTIAGEKKDDLQEDEQEIEYEDTGCLPEGAFFFHEHFPIVHVGNHGVILQIDLMKRLPRSDKVLNKEFKNILITDVKERDWDAIARIFMKSD